MATRDSWNEAFADWRATPENALLRSYSDLVNKRLIARWLPHLHLARVLKTDLFDEAVGEGLYLELRTAGATVAGVDVSTAVVTEVKNKYVELQAEVGDVRRLRFAEASFDVVISNSTLDHFESFADVAAALSELYRVLRPGGTLLVTLDNAANPLVALRNAIPARLLRGIGLVHYPLGVTCGPGRLDALVRAAGFAPERAGAVMHFPRVVARAIAAVVGDRRGVPAFLIAFERLDRWPLRYLSGQFVAMRAVKPQTVSGPAPLDALTTQASS